MANIVLVRHGEINPIFDKRGRQLLYGHEATLSIPGIASILKLAAKLRSETIHASDLALEKPRNFKLPLIYTSHARRARQSADIIAKNFQTISHIDLRLNELKIPGWAGKLLDEFNQVDIFSPGARLTSDQETWVELTTRVTDFFRKILLNKKETQLKTERNIIIVSHDFILPILAYRISKQEKRERDEGFPTYSELTAEFNIKKAQGFLFEIGNYSRVLETRIISGEVKPRQVEQYKEIEQSFPVEKLG